MPERIQLQRTKGWRKPEGAVVVARPTRWGNPFTIAAYGSRARAVQRFEEWLTRGTDLDAQEYRVRIPELAGQALACWCSLDEPCHADVLLKLANPTPREDRP